MKYYIKKLGHQELGSVGSDGRPNRGRYIFISKNREILSMFPPLSEVVFNDSALLPMLALYSNHRTYCTFVYHNDSLSRPGIGTRNEYRLYLNSELENHLVLLKQNNYVIMRKVSITIDEIESSYFAFDYGKHVRNC